MRVVEREKESRKRVYIETYGCAMNVADSEVVVSILTKAGWEHTTKAEEADLILINTCSIRDNAEQRVWGRIANLKPLKNSNKSLKFGVLGCMAGRLKEELIEKNQAVDIIAGPDAYRDLPRLIDEAIRAEKGVNVMLSSEETYAEISPVRLDTNGVSAFVSIMRGCNNMCSYCVVPYTRGRERSRDVQTILNEVVELHENGYKEVTLLGQNVNSYNWSTQGESVDFPTLLEQVAGISPNLRVRFSTSHPKDLSDRLIEVIANNKNICRSIHLPAQSGSNRVLKSMNRRYTREWYMGRIEAIRRFIPDVTISTDFISGFCGETEDEHQQTLSLISEMGYYFAYMYAYSERPNTRAEKTMEDDVAADVKGRRLAEVIAHQQKYSLKSNLADVGKTFEVLADSISKRSDEQLSGRTSQNKIVIFDRANHAIGEYVEVEITDCTPATLFGRTV